MKTFIFEVFALSQSYTERTGEKGSQEKKRKNKLEKSKEREKEMKSSKSIGWNNRMRKEVQHIAVVKKTEKHSCDHCGNPSVREQNCLLQ